jgi:hypothetical protein
MFFLGSQLPKQSVARATPARRCCSPSRASVLQPLGLDKVITHFYIGHTRWHMEMCAARVSRDEPIMTKCTPIIQSSSSPGCHLRATSEYPVIALPLPITPTLPSSEVANMLVFFIPLEIAPATKTCQQRHARQCKINLGNTCDHTFFLPKVLSNDFQEL